jgi:alkyl sulfatase BDS1-like metallo-beta-lactamase superfamily hydrolase
MSSRRGLATHADATVLMPRTVLLAISANEATIDDVISSGSVTVTGDAEAIRAVFGHLDTFQSMFKIIEP